MNRRQSLLAIGAAALMFCAAQTPAPIAAAATPAAGVLTENGYGPLRVGMSWALARRAMPTLHSDMELGEQCFEATASNIPGLYAMFEDHRLVRVSIADANPIRTALGARLGQTAAQVRAIYGPRLRVEPHHYQGPAAQYLTWWTIPDRRGIRFETDTHRRITTIHAGGPAIAYVEGCA